MTQQDSRPNLFEVLFRATGPLQARVLQRRRNTLIKALPPLY